MFRSRFRGVGGYREVLAVSLPLIVSMASNTLMQFTDRMFLAGYSVDAIAAAMPAGMAVFLVIALFMGTGGYVNVFVAQYVGAGRPQRVGAALWQGIWFSLLASVLLALLALPADLLFSLAGHPEAVRRLEVVYFQILALGAGFSVLGSVISCFYTGRGQTRVVMLANMAGAALNVPLDYALINGAWGLPELGIAGAGIATIVSAAFICLILALLIFRRANEADFRVRSAWRPERELFGRLMRFGLPGGVQFCMDMLAITFFIFMVGRLGRAELAATNIVFNISTLAFMPMIGVHVAVSTLVGQAIGRGRPEDGARATTSAVHISLLYMSLFGLAFVFMPEPLLNLFRPADASDAEFAAIVEAGIVLLRFVTLYNCFDALGIIYSGAIRGAGDTLFVMKAIAVVALLTVFAPVTILSTLYQGSLYQLWACATLYISALGLAFALRYRQGAWRSMRVIESEPAPLV